MTVFEVGLFHKINVSLSFVSGEIQFLFLLGVLKDS